MTRVEPVDGKETKSAVWMLLTALSHTKDTYGTYPRNGGDKADDQQHSVEAWV